MAENPGLPRLLKVTIAYLHVISASHFLLGFVVIIGGTFRFLGESIAALMIIAILGIMLVVIAVGFEIINAGLKESSYWAWVMALIACTIHLLIAIMILITLGAWGIIGSFIFLFLGIFGLSGLLVNETKTFFFENRYRVKDIDEAQVT